MGLDTFIGEIQIVAFPYAPPGFALCDGSLLPIAQHSALYSLLGTTYGGDGVNTFALPDLRGRAPLGIGAGPGLQPVHPGDQGGVEAVTLVTSQLPAHNHTATVQPGASAQQKCFAGIGSQASPVGAVAAEVLEPVSGGALPAFAHAQAANQSMAPLPLQLEIGIGATGGGQAIGIRNPYAALNFIIALEGIYPSRG
jgi:microcystin-dependent protein